MKCDTVHPSIDDLLFYLHLIEKKSITHLNMNNSGIHLNKTFKNSEKQRIRRLMQDVDCGAVLQQDFFTGIRNIRDEKKNKNVINFDCTDGSDIITMNLRNGVKYVSKMIPQRRVIVDVNKNGKKLAQHFKMRTLKSIQRKRQISSTKKCQLNKSRRVCVNKGVKGVRSCQKAVKSKHSCIDNLN